MWRTAQNLFMFMALFVSFPNFCVFWSCLKRLREKGPSEKINCVKIGIGGGGLAAGKNTFFGAPK